MTPQQDTPLLSRGAQNILIKMVEAHDAGDFEGAELVCEGRDCYVGLYRTSPRIVFELLRSCLIHSDSSERSGMSTLYVYTLNEDGRKAALDPTWVNPAITKALKGRK
jgi:hypothetical protein